MRFQPQFSLQVTENLHTTKIIIARNRHSAEALDPFIPNEPFLYPLKTSENRKVFIDLMVVIVEWVLKN